MRHLLGRAYPHLGIVVDVVGPEAYPGLPLWGFCPHCGQAEAWATFAPSEDPAEQFDAMIRACSCQDPGVDFRSP